MKRNGFVKAVRGPNGGYKLALKAEEIIMSDVIELIEGKIETKGCSQKHISCTGISGKCLNHDLWDELGKQINLFLSHISLKGEKIYDGDWVDGIRRCRAMYH